MNNTGSYLIMRIQTNLFTTYPVILLFCGAVQDSQGTLKTLNFQACFQGRESQKTCPQGFKQKHEQISLRRITRKRFWRKHGFCNTFHTKTLSKGKRGGANTFWTPKIAKRVSKVTAVT
jgi:hypothetical protein